MVEMPGVPGGTEERPVGFVLQLDLKRIELGLGHRAFAEGRLLIDRTHWFRLRHNGRGVTMDLVRRAVELWPEDFAHLELGTLMPEDGDGNEQAG